MNAMISRPVGGETTAAPNATTDAAVVSGPTPNPIPISRAALIAAAGMAMASSGATDARWTSEDCAHVEPARLPAADVIGYLGSRLGGVPGSAEPWPAAAVAPCGPIP